jgi:ribosomal protein S18 acetylase RimI-like enzyme
MTNFLNFETFHIDRKNVEMHLFNSKVEFYSKELSGWVKFLDRYSKLSKEREILFCALRKNHEVIASCVLVRGTIRVDQELIPFYFLTQAITNPQFRGQGLFRTLLEEVEVVAKARKVSVLVTIARRAVADFYWKLGFQGFSHFPEYINIRRDKGVTQDLFRYAELCDVDQLQLCHSNSRALSNSRIARSVVDWEFIVNEGKLGNYQVLLPKNSAHCNYLIVKEDCVIELSKCDSIVNECDFYTLVNKSFNQLKLDSMHPISNFLLGNSWKYRERFESKEGHLLKVIGPITLNSRYFLDEVVLEFGKHRFEISEIDQW